MKKLLFVVMAIMIASFAFAGWGGTAFTDSTIQSYGQGLAVDGAGKIWYGSYYKSDSILVPEHHDTTATGGDTTIAAAYSGCRAVYVFNPDGTQASFSPIKTVTTTDGTDTLWNTQRGYRTDPNGDVVIGSWCVYYRITHLTGEGIGKKLLPYPTDPATWSGESVVDPAFDDAGNMFTNCVVAGAGPIKAFDTSWDPIADVVDASNLSSYSRTIEVSGDGNDIYFCNFGTPLVVRFHSDAGVYGTYAAVDTIKNIPVEAISWGKGDQSGYLWMGNMNTCAHYAYDPTTKTYVDSIMHPEMAVLGAKPRGIDFTADGDTAYITYFNTWDNDAVYRFVKGTGSAVWENDAVISVNGFELGNNYPNPFNPTTTIPFTIQSAGNVKLSVYNVNGQLIETLVNGYKNAGSYDVVFDGAKHSSGIYMYKLTVGRSSVTRRLTLLK